MDNETDKLRIMSGISDLEFRLIIEAVDGYVDYEFMIIILALHYMKRARDMYHDGLEEASAKYEEKSDKLASFVQKYRQLNRI